MSDNIDLSFLKTFTNSDPDKMKKYINMFLSSAPGMIDKMKSDSESADWKALKTSSHSIKTQLKYMGAEKAQSMAYEIEQLSDRATDVDILPGKVTELTELCQTVIKELNGEIEKL